jgi:hypothetical protein
MDFKTKYRVVANIKGFNGVSFDSRKEAEIHISEDLIWIEDKPQYSHLKHEIKKVQVEVNPKKEIFKYFLDY